MSVRYRAWQVGPAALQVPSLDNGVSFLSGLICGILPTTGPIPFWKDSIEDFLGRTDFLAVAGVWESAMGMSPLDPLGGLPRSDVLAVAGD